MRVYDLKTMQACEIKENTFVALGTFDGCHTGHGSVLRTAFYEAKKMGVKSLVYTFDTSSVKGEGCIMTLEEKIKAISKYQLDYIAIEDFESIKNKSGYEFISTVLFEELKAVGATCGFNYRFGKGATSTAENLKEIFEKSGRRVCICEKITHEGKIISSTYIRGLIKDGDFERANMFMMPYTVFSLVERGKGLGKKMGFATINQKIPQGKIVPKVGVYITDCEIGEDVYPSVTNVGYRPTTDGEGAELNVETHIIGFDKELYSSYLRIRFYKYIREEKRFGSVEELTEQIAKDVTSAKKYLGYFS